MEEELTLTGLLKKAASDFPDRRAVSIPWEFEFDLTRARLQELVDQAATLLATYGIGPGDVVALALPNIVEFVILFLAVIRCRATAALLDVAYKATEFWYYLSDLQPTLLVTPNEGNRLAQSTASKLNIPHLTAKLHSADSKITLSSTDIRPNLNLVSKVINDPSDVSLYLYDWDIPGHNFSEVALYLHNRNIPAFSQRVQFTQKELATVVLSKKRKYAKSPDSTVIENPWLHYRHLALELLNSLAAGTAAALPAATAALPAATAAARSSASRFLADTFSSNATRHTADDVACVRYRSKVARPYQSNDMPEGNNAPKTNKENKTKTERGGEEGGHCAKLIEEFEKLSGPKKFSYEDSMIATDSFAHDWILGAGGFGDNVACVRSKVARPYRSNDMREGKNAPTTTVENKTETKRGGEEGKLKEELYLTQKKRKEEEEELTNLGGPKKYSYGELSSATNSFASGLKLGGGGFGIMYKGYIGEDRTPVAVKKIRHGSRQGREEYISEVKSLSQLGHTHLVQLKGYCHEANKFILVYEFMRQGSLADHLFEDKPLLTWERRYSIALGLAKALHYLQKQFRQCVIHRDIKSDNVMLNEKFEAKLGDFGLAKLVDHTRDPSITRVKGTPGYWAPEYFRTGKTSKESDIYSFGIVLLEILCGKKASDSKLAEHGGLVLWVWKRSGCSSWWGRRFWNLHLPVDERLGKDFDKKQAEALMIVGLCCAHPIARSRPSIEEAMAVLNLTKEPRKLSSKMPSFNI